MGKISIYPRKREILFSEGGGALFTKNVGFSARKETITEVIMYIIKKIRSERDQNQTARVGTHLK
jgi:hypothetical protein